MALDPYGVWPMKSFTRLMTWKIFCSGSFVGSPSVIVINCSKVGMHRRPVAPVSASE